MQVPSGINEISILRAMYVVEQHRVKVGILSAVTSDIFNNCNVALHVSER